MDTRLGCAATVASRSSGWSASVQIIRPTPKGSCASAGSAHCSVTNPAVCRPLTPIMPRPPASETARGSAPPETPAIGAPMTGVVRSNQRVSDVVITDPSCPAGPLLGGGTALLGALQAAQELVAAPGARGVLLHHLAEEARDVVQARVLGVPHVLPVVVPCLERVVLHRDEVVVDVLEAGLTGGHRSSSWW